MSINYLGKYYIIRYLDLFQINEVADIVKVLDDRFSLKTRTGVENVEILKSLAFLRFDQINTLIDLAMTMPLKDKDTTDQALDQLLIKNTKGTVIADRFKLLGGFKNTDFTNASAIIELVRENLLPQDTAKIDIDTLKDIYYYFSLATTTDAAKIILQEMPSFLPSNQNGQNLISREALEFIKILQKVPAANELDSLLGLVKRFTGRSSAEKSFILENLAQIPKGNRQSIVECYAEISQNIRTQMNDQHIANALMILNRLPDQEDRQTAIRIVNQRAVNTPNAYLRELEQFIRIMPREFKPREYYKQLDAKFPHINREKLQAAQKPLLPAINPKKGPEIIQDFDAIIQSLSLTDKLSNNYLSYEMIASKAQRDEDNERNVKSVILKARGYLKVLFDVPLQRGEDGGWQTQEDQKPVLKNVIQAILEKLLKTDDPSTKASNMAVFMNGLLYCPTGQKEGIETVVGALFANRNQGAASLEEKINQIVATFKEDQLNFILTDPYQTQNVHLRSYYKEILGKDLGIQSVLTGFKERLHTPDRDIFSGDPLIVLKRFFEGYGQISGVMPQTLAAEILKHVENKEDLERQKEIENIQEKMREIRVQLAPSKSPSGTLEQQLENLTTQLQTLKKQKHDVQTYERPIATGIIISYVYDTHQLGQKNEQNQETILKKYFDLDEDGNPILLHQAGAFQLLVDLGYIVVSPGGADS